VELAKGLDLSTKELIEDPFYKNYCLDKEIRSIKKKLWGEESDLYESDVFNFFQDDPLNK